MRSPRCRSLAWLLRRGWLCLLGLPLTLAAVAQPLPEHQLKAKVLLQALLFVDWPAQAAAGPLLLCLVDPPPFAQALRALAGQPLNGRALELREWRAGEPLPASPCRVALVGPQALALLASPQSGVLVVSDGDGTLRRGAMLNLQLDQGRVVFDINLATTRAAGLDISARLLRLARFVAQE